MSIKELEIPISVLDHEEEMNHYAWDSDFPVQYSYDIEGLEERLQSLDVYRLSDQWFSKFTGSVYFGILCFEPWCNLGFSEEQIWSLLLQHAEVDVTHWKLHFRFNPDHPQFGFLRTHAKDGNVEHDVKVLFRYALQIDIENSDNWTMEELVFCPDCDAYVVPKTGFQWCDCSECGKDLTED